jgi:E3 ubiquitin-protein ligase NRDP1
MTKGTLSISLNDTLLGVAFEDEELKQGPIWPAIGLLHVAGCSLVTGRASPSCFYV